MPREMRPWYRPHLDGFCLGWALIAGLGVLGSVELVRHGYFDGLWLFVPCTLVLGVALRDLWTERNPWIYETRRGRKVKVTRCFRDEYDVCIDGRCARVYAELLTNGVQVSFSSISKWTNSEQLMTEDERVDVLNVLLEEFEAQGTRVEFFNNLLPDTPQVKIARARLEREYLRR